MRRLIDEFVNWGDPRDGKFPAEGRAGPSLCEVREGTIQRQSI